MNNLKISFYIAITLFVISGCVDEQSTKAKSKEKIVGQEQDEYAFFPDDAGLKTGDVYIVDTSAFYNTVGVLFKRKLTDIEINELQKKNYLATLKASDPCLIVINDFINQKTEGQKLTNQKSFNDNSCKKKKIPIPNFHSIDSVDSKSHLNRDCLIFIADLKYGVFSERIDTKKSSMPKNMFHGEVSGIVMDKSKSEAIYFVHKW